jgi:cold shock protein
MIAFSPGGQLRTREWLSDDKGFAFIAPDELGENLLVHHGGIAGDGFKSLAESAKVSYDSVGRRGRSVFIYGAVRLCFGSRG